MLQHPELAPRPKHPQHFPQGPLRRSHTTEHKARNHGIEGRIRKRKVLNIGLEQGDAMPAPASTSERRLIDINGHDPLHGGRIPRKREPGTGPHLEDLAGQPLHEAAAGGGETHPPERSHEHIVSESLHVTPGTKEKGPGQDGPGPSKPTVGTPRYRAGAAPEVPEDDAGGGARASAGTRMKNSPHSPYRTNPMLPY